VGKKNRRRASPRRGQLAAPPPGALRPEEILAHELDGVWTAVAAQDVLAAEIETAAVIALPYFTQVLGEAAKDDFASDYFVRIGRRRRDPQGAAFLRVLACVGSPAVRREARSALGDLTSEGIFPLDWVAEVGKPVPGEAWRRYDVFGDEETIAVTFRYGDAVHAIVVKMAYAFMPVAASAGIVTDAAGLDRLMTRPDEQFYRAERIDLAGARLRVEGALDRGEHVSEFSEETIRQLAMVRSRLRRLPAGGTWQPPVFSAEDRKAAVWEFLASPEAVPALACDADSVRSWAEVFTGFSARTPGDRPGQVSPARLRAMLLSHVPFTFAISPAQRRQLEPAAAAWVRWACARQGYDPAATAHVEGALREVLRDFDTEYANPVKVAGRGYVADLARSDRDAAWLARCFSRRHFAVPLPDDREGPGGVESLDAGDPAARRAIVAAEFADCELPGGPDAACRVVEEMWHDEPHETWLSATKMLADGLDRHDIIHALVE
jgi:hypothetical protein